MGVYPLLEDDTCFLLAVDLDEADWQQDAPAFMRSRNGLGVPAALEISRSSQGAHAWLFFTGRVSARDARRLGTAIISHGCARTRHLRLASCDRLFPNQDMRPSHQGGSPAGYRVGGFGNLFALPLQKHPRHCGCSVFVDAELRPHGDQWAYLAAIQLMAPHDIEPAILRATGSVHPPDVTFIDDVDLATPWRRQVSTSTKLARTMPQALPVTLGNLIHFEKSALRQALANRLIRLAAFQNPEFYRAQHMRMSVWNKPRVIGNAEKDPQHIALPRGCLDAALALLKDNGIRCDLQDERVAGGGKAKPSGKIDIAVMQSLSRQGDVNALVENYGQIVVDESHHVGAASFDAILERTKAMFVLGLTATPIRRHGQQPIVSMQCGQIRHTAARPASAPHDLEIAPRSRFARIDLPATAGIQDLFRHLANDLARTEAIAAEAALALGQGRKVLVLTERTEHLEATHQALTAQSPPPFVLHGRMSKKQRAALIAELLALPPDAPRILLATGKLVGEGYDHPPLDTPVPAMPVSCKGSLQHYAGRLHREHASKADVQIVDFVDAGHPALLRMREKRQRGYRAMGYRVDVDARNHRQSSVGDPGVPGTNPFEHLHAGKAAAAHMVGRSGPSGQGSPAHIER